MRARTWVALAAALFGASLLYLLVVALTDEDLANARDDFPLLLLALSALAAFGGWQALRRREQQAIEREAEAERRAAEEERQRREIQRARERERAWARELQRRLAELHRERGALGNVDDVRELVLRTAVALVEAEKGLLLSRLDEDSDGDLDFVCAVGFENDPEQSAVAQHFARQVIDRDRTVRSDDPREFVDGNRTPADDEIDNLVAIPIWMRDRFSGVVVCANRNGGFADLDDEVLLTLGDHAGAVLAGARLRGELRGAFLTTVRVLADAVEAKDRELRVHSNEVARYVSEVAARVGLDPRQREELVFASLLHDVGKIGVSERILLKPGPLTPDERLVVELHSKVGHRLIEQIPELRRIAPAVLHHHERWDGEGYPAKLRGQDTPIEARLIGIVDAFCAMLSDRPYRNAMTVDEACEELKRCAGTQFDPSLVRLFIEEIERRPPGREVPPDLADALSIALGDPELDIRRAHDEHLLGETAFSVVDNLTLLYAHRFLHDVAQAEAERAVVQGNPFGVLIACVDKLADVNRDRGYAAGDDALRAAAEAVQRVAGRCGGTAARESGTRIALLVPGAGDEVAEQLARDLEGELAGQDVTVTWAVWFPGESGDDVIARARSERKAAPVPS